MARRHRMTPKRRAALRKAQLASARKRKRRFGAVRDFAKGAATVGGAVGGMFVAYHTQEYIARPDKLVRHTGMAGRATGRAVSGGVRRVTGHRTSTKVHAKPHSNNWHKFGYL